MYVVKSVPLARWVTVGMASYAETRTPLASFVKATLARMPIMFRLLIWVETKFPTDQNTTILCPSARVISSTGCMTWGCPPLAPVHESDDGIRMPDLACPSDVVCDSLIRGNGDD